MAVSPYRQGRYVHKRSSIPLATAGRQSVKGVWYLCHCHAMSANYQLLTGPCHVTNYGTCCCNYACQAHSQCTPRPDAAVLPPLPSFDSPA
jgi:hypothetical protein